MKGKTLSILVIIILAVFSANAQTKAKLNPVGTWKFEAPAAPEGYTNGTIVVGLQEKAHTASISFAGSEYKLPGEKVKFEGDSLKFDVYLEGATINIMMKMNSETAMSGKALTPDGEVPLTLKKEPAKS
ncbi:MAG: hypothetical protein ACM3UT_10550 [Chloroflexota bacterium]